MLLLQEKKLCYVVTEEDCENDIKLVGTFCWTGIGLLGGGRGRRRNAVPLLFPGALCSKYS